MKFHQVLGTLAASIVFLTAHVQAQDFSAIAKTYRPKLETNLNSVIMGFWYPQTVDTTNGGYILNHDIEGRLKPGGTKMIVTQSRMLWLFSHLARLGYGGKEYVDAADNGYRFLRDKMWDQKNGGFYWEVNSDGTRALSPRKHLYGQAFGLYALSEYYLATGNKESLALAVKLFDLIEEKAYDKTYGGYKEWFNEDWSPADGNTYMGEPDLKLMNTHLHLLEAMTMFYRASKLPLARERLLELITIESDTVVRKGMGACTDKYQQDWQPILTGNYARVSYGHDLENIWLLKDACDAAGISNYPFLDLYRTLFDYSMKYGFDTEQGGFFNNGPFNQPAADRSKVWWVQAEACVSALYMYRLTHEVKYLDVFQKTYDWIEKHQVDWQHGDWFETVLPTGVPTGDKASMWKAGYHNGRAMMECLEILKGRP